MKNQTKTKSRAISDADAAERKAEIDEFLLHSYAARAKSRQLIEDYLDGKLAPEEDKFE